MYAYSLLLRVVCVPRAPRPPRSRTPPPSVCASARGGAFSFLLISHLTFEGDTPCRHSDCSILYSAVPYSDPYVCRLPGRHPRNFWAGRTRFFLGPRSSGFMESWVRSHVGALETGRARTPQARQRCAALPSRAQGRGWQALLTIVHATYFYRPRSPSPARVPSAAARDMTVPCPGRVRVRVRVGVGVGVRVSEGAMSWSALLRSARLGGGGRQQRARRARA